MITDNEHKDTYTIYSQSSIIHMIVLWRVRILFFKAVANFCRKGGDWDQVDILTLTMNLYLFGPFGEICIFFKVEFRKFYHIYNKNICQEYQENKT